MRFFSLNSRTIRNQDQERPIVYFLVRYGLALVLALLALLARFSLAPVLLDTQPFAMCYLVAALTTWLAGLFPGLLATGFSIALSYIYFVHPRDAGLPTPQSLARTVVALLISVSLCLIIDRLRRVGRRGMAAEDSLHQRESQLHLIMDEVPALISYVDAGYRYRLANRTYLRWFGLDSARIQGRHVREVLGQATWQAVRPYMDRALHGETVTYEEQLPYLGDRPRWVHVTYTPDRKADGRVRGFVVMVHDVTARKLEEVERGRLAAIVSSSHDAIFSKSLDGTILSWNAAAERMYGYTAEEMIGHPIANIVPPERKAELDEIMDRLRRGERIEQLETERVRKDGRRIRVSITISPIRDAEGGIIAESTIARDVTAQHAAEAANEANLNQLEAIIGSMREGLVIADLGGNILRLNPAALRMHGFESSEQARSHLSEFPRLLEVAGLAGAPLPAAAWPIARAIRGETFTDQEYRVRRRDTGQEWIASYTGTPVRDRGGNAILAIVTIRDVTAQKQAEEALRASNERLAEADRRKDEFLAMLAHELRNPLAPIRYAVQLLQLAETDNPRLRRQHDIIDRQISHMGRLLDDLLDVSRITRGKIQLRREDLDMRAVAGNAVESMRSLFEERHQQLVFQAPSAALPIHGDPTRLEQVMRNLLHNAAKYTEPGGCIALMLSVEAAGEQAWQAAVRIRDSGIGIAPEMLEQVFEPFVQAEQSLARTQGGLGIGLSMVQSLVALHGGSVEVYSAGQGHGSEFVVRLPLASPGGVQAWQPPQPDAAAEEAAPGRRVLVVDDNEDAALSLAELLGLWGYQVRTAFDGPAALDIAEPWHPEVVLLDIGLPGMDGYEVAGRLRRMPGCAGARIVALTGYGGEEDRRRALESGFDSHLTKPASVERLQEMLHQAHAA